MEQTSSYPVQVFIYDVTKGMARQLSPVMIGKQIEGVWHTAIVVHGKEFFFGGAGINHCAPGNTILGPPELTVDLGSTEVPEEVFMEYLTSLGESTFSGDKYHLLDHNCNTFSNEVAQFLTGKRIPSYVTDLPSEVMSTPFGQALRPFLESMTINPGGNNVRGQQ